MGIPRKLVNLAKLATRHQTHLKYIEVSVRVIFNLAWQYGTRDAFPRITSEFAAEGTRLIFPDDIDVLSYTTRYVKWG